MKNLIMALVVLSLLLGGGYAQAADKACCGATTCVCASGKACCVDGKCACKGDCCKDKCRCAIPGACKDCGCKEQKQQ